MRKLFLSFAGVTIASAALGAGSIKQTHIAALNGVRNTELPRVKGEFLVTINGSVENSPALDRLLEQGAKIIRRYRSSETVLVKMPSSEGSVSFRQAMTGLLAAEDVKNVEANTVLKMLAVPDDERFSELYGMQNTGQTEGLEGADIRATEAWDVTTGSLDVLVGVIDTGIDGTHPDLVDNMWSNPGETGLDENGNDKATNGIDDDENGYVDDHSGWDFVNNDNDPFDDQGHGTHCAGTIGAKGNNGIGVAGVNWEVSLVGLKFLGGDGTGTLSDALAAIEYSTTLGVNLTSNSWGGGGYSEPMADAIREAESAGILFVAAAGNESNDNDRNPSYPSSYPLSNVISVAATDHNDELAFFSNYGRNTVHLAAPGVDVLSTVPGNKYDFYSGTSMACPHVAGAAALLWSEFPDASFHEIKARLIGNVQGISSVRSSTIAAGRLSLPLALEQDEVSPSAVETVTVDSADLFTADISWTIAGDDDTEGRAHSYELRYLAEEDFGTLAWEDAAVLAVVRDTDPGEALESLGTQLENLEDDFRGYLAVRAADNVGNFGEFSQETFVQLADRVFLAQVNADDTTGVEFEGTWGVEEQEDGSLVFSDSPEGSYTEETNTSLTLPFVDGNFSVQTYLTFWNTYDLEPRYDYGFVEIRVPGGEWVELEQVNGVKSRHKVIIALPEEFSGAESLQVRFRLSTDVSINYDGWKIENVSFVQAL